MVAAGSTAQEGVGSNPCILSGFMSTRSIFGKTVGKYIRQKINLLTVCTLSNNLLFIFTFNTSLIDGINEEFN